MNLLTGNKSAPRKIKSLLQRLSPGSSYSRWQTGLSFRGKFYTLIQIIQGGLAKERQAFLPILKGAGVPYNQTDKQPLCRRACWNHSNWPILDQLTSLNPFLHMETTIEALVHSFSTFICPGTDLGLPCMVPGHVACHPSWKLWEITIFPNVVISWYVALVCSCWVALVVSNSSQPHGL